MVSSAESDSATSRWLSNRSWTLNPKPQTRKFPIQKITLNPKPWPLTLDLLCSSRPEAFGDWARGRSHEPFFNSLQTRVWGLDSPYKSPSPAQSSSL